MRPRWVGAMNFRRKFLLSVLAGALAALGHAPFDLWPVALLALAWLVWLVSIEPLAGRASVLAWAGGVGYFAIALHWIVQPFLVDVARHGWMAPFALVFVAAGLALFWGLAGWVSTKCPPRPIGFALALALAELARGYVLTGFPWALPAYVWTETPVRLTAALVGPFGLTALTLLIVSFPSLGQTRTRRLSFAGLSLVAIAALFATGLARDGDDNDQDKKIRLVQPNAPQHEKWDPEKAHLFVERMITFTQDDKGEVPPDLIIWPETAIPYRLDRADSVLSRLASAADGIPVVTGINRSDQGRNHNALITVERGGKVTQTYDKVHLVPFGEYIPFGQLARIVGLKSFAARDGYGFSPGPSVHLIDTPIGRALPLICYEAIFPQHIHASPERPDYLLQITNDAWFGTFSGPYQHLQQARFRAVEQGLPLVRVANTGVSAVIDARGEIKISLPLGKAGYRDAQLPVSLPPTLYSRTGDIPVAVVLLFMLGALTWTGWRNAIANGQ
ncbi:MAG: apolipoprotein N-acyltransferase [Silicimonas sp.]|nr:apolipoprotein N-acyltransferase [Silicimonas sp.]